MKLELEIPDNHSLALESGSPTKDGSRHWRAWVRRDGKDNLRGGSGFTPQEAIDRAVDHLKKSEAASASAPDTRFAGLKLNLQLLKKD